MNGTTPVDLRMWDVNWSRPPCESSSFCMVRNWHGHWCTCVTGNGTGSCHFRSRAFRWMVTVQRLAMCWCGFGCLSMPSTRKSYFHRQDKIFAIFSDESTKHSWDWSPVQLCYLGCLKPAWTFPGLGKRLRAGLFSCIAGSLILY